MTPLLPPSELLHVSGTPAARSVAPVASEPSRSGSWTIAPGERIAVLGANGAGKSTLLRTLAGIDPARRTTVSYGSTPLDTLRGDARARCVAWLPQDELAPPGLTVREAIALGRAPQRSASLGETPNRGTKRLFAASPIDDHDPLVEELIPRFRLETLADRPLETLSGGERKRVALARLFAQKTPFALLDEPFAPLDASTARYVLDLLHEESARGTALIVALHDPNLALEFATRVILLENGHIVADGPLATTLHEEALARIHGGAFAAATRDSDGARRWVPASSRASRERT